MSFLNMTGPYLLNLVALHLQNVIHFEYVAEVEQVKYTN